MRVFLSGGTGMVGRNVLEHPDATSIDWLAPSRANLDLLDSVAVTAYLRREKPDCVIHAAGTVGGIRANMEMPVRFLADNLKMGMNVILGAKDAGVANLLNIGSSCMYPRAAQNPLKEECILNGELEPTNEGYAIAKITCARLCTYIMREDPSFQYKTIIPCNLYGRHDKFDLATAHMLPAAIRKVSDAMSSGEDSVTIWGDGQARREFMYAGDLADFIFVALRQFDRLPEMLNVGLGKDLSINDYYHAIAQVLGYHGRFEHDLSKPTGMKQKLVDIGRLQDTGWIAKTSIEDGIALSLNYFRNL